MLHSRRRDHLLRLFRTNADAEFALAWLEALRAEQDPDEAAPEPLLDDWRELLQAGLPQLRTRRQGHVYVAAYLPHRDVYKVGQTAKAPAERVSRLRTAGVLAPLVLVHSRSVADRHFVETRAHRQLAKARVVREFFQADHAAVVAALNLAADRDEQMWALAFRRAGLSEPVGG